MAAYLIVLREELSDPDLYNEYLGLATAASEGHSPKPLAVLGKTRVLEGANVETGVLLEFATFEDAEKWYFSDGYQKVLPKRLAAGKFRSVIIEGFEPPAG